ncbi:hypothetical protein ACL58G_07745 [Massilia sp. GER05]|uniref:hypothetical protein n=1 Tax=Massilia sp. GER05 TaxID=3394605 RepID=UPI003F869D6F
MELKHTPGPWRAGSGTGGKGSVVSDQLAVGALGGSDAVEYYGGNLIAESIAPENIPLIAAAPELLDVVIMMRDADDDCGLDGLPRIPCSARAAIDAAIARATGSAA